jgi:hypothetical protein
MSRVYFDIKVDDEYIGRIVFDLFDQTPETCVKFTANLGNLFNTKLLTHEDLVMLDLKNMEFNETLLESEISHDDVGLLTTNNSKYFVTSQKSLKLDGKYQVRLFNDWHSERLLRGCLYS